MAHTPRQFGKPAPLHAMIERGVEFFDVIKDTEIDEVLEHSKRVNKIAITAAHLAAEKLRLEGDTVAQQLVYAAYLGIGDITAGTLTQVGEADKTEALLTSERTHHTLLLASKTLRSYAFDQMTRQYRREGTGFSLEEDGLVLQPGLRIPEKHRGLGCPYAQGNAEKAAYFNECTDTIVRTYTEASRRHMPKNLTQQILRRH